MRLAGEQYAKDEGSPPAPTSMPEKVKIDQNPANSETTNRDPPFLPNQ